MKKFNFNNDKLFLLILLLISFGIFGCLNYLSLDYLILLRFSLLIIICLLVLSFFYVSKFENFSIFLICLIIVTNIIILISFTNYHTENFKEIVLFGYKVLPTNPSNQKFIFLLLNTFVLFFIIENNNNFTFKLLISILIIINFLFLLRYANTYIIFLTILSILYIFYFKILRFSLSKRIILGIKFLFVGTCFLYLIIFWSSIPKNIILKIIDYKVESTQLLDQKNLIKNYIYDGHHYLLKCTETFNEFKNYKDDSFIPEYFRINKDVSEYKKVYINLVNLDCYGRNHTIYVGQTLESFYPLIGLLSRTDQMNKYKKDLSFDLSFVFFGMDPLKFDKELNLGNFTHNSFYNILLRYGLIFSLILLYFLSNLFIRSSSFYFDIIFMIIIMSQLFDDYLIGNRSELSFFIWFLLGNFFRTKEKHYENV